MIDMYCSPPLCITYTRGEFPFDKYSIKMVVLIMHYCDFIVDLDGQITCSICGSRDDEMVIWTDPYNGIDNQLEFE